MKTTICALALTVAGVVAFPVGAYHTLNPQAYVNDMPAVEWTDNQIKTYENTFLAGALLFWGGAGAVGAGFGMGYVESQRLRRQNMRENL